MFDKIRQALRRGGDKLENLGQKYIKTIWELDGVPAFRQYWTYGIFPWKWVYRGKYNAWHILAEPTIADPKHTRDMFRLNPAKFVSATLAKYVWDERCDINVSMVREKKYNADGKAIEQEDPLQDFINEVFTQNNFYTKLGELYEQGAALGGGALKCRCEFPKETDGKDMVIDEDAPIMRTVTNDAGQVLGKSPCKIVFSYHMADQFVPTAWTNADITGAIFLYREAKDGYYYTRVESHTWEGDDYVITNEVYREREAEVNRLASVEGIEPQNILGWYYPLDQIYPLISPRTVVKNIKRSLFSYFRVAGANNLDDNSPLGMSIYGNAMDTLRAIDIAFDGFVREVQLSKKRIIVPARACKSITITDPTTGTQRQVQYFDPNDSVYQALNFENTEDLKVHDNTMEMRVDNYVAAINADLSLLCAQLGLDANMLAFDKAQGLKTATEVVSENSKTYGTIQTHQNILQDAIERFVHNIIDVAAGYDVEYNGMPISDLIAGGYEVSVHFDDSVIQDRQTNINEGILLTGNGLMSKKTFLTKILGLTDEQANAEIAAIKDEGKIDVSAIDQFKTYSSEE